MKSKTVPPIHRVELSGSHLDMGRQHGDILRHVIRELADARIDLLARTLRLGSLARVQSVCSQMAEATSALQPDVHDEFRGAAQASGLPLWKLIAAGAYSDVLDVAARGQDPRFALPSECTLVTLHSGGSPVLLGTWDSHGSAGSALTLCKRSPSLGPSTAALTTAGWPLQQGVTSQRLAFAIANMVADRVSRGGVPYIAALMSVSAHADAHAAADHLRTIRHASGRYYQLCDATTCIGQEVVPGRGAASSALLPMCHTNHYILESSRSYEGRDDIQDSKRRLALARTFAARQDLEGLGGDELLLLFARSGVVAAGDGTVDTDATHAAFLLAPAERSLYYLCHDALRLPELDDIDVCSI